MPKKAVKKAKPNARITVNAKGVRNVHQTPLQAFKDEFKKDKSGNYNHKSGKVISLKIRKGYNDWDGGRKTYSDRYILLDENGSDMIGEHMPLATAFKRAMESF